MNTLAEISRSPSTNGLLGRFTLTHFAGEPIRGESRLVNLYRFLSWFLTGFFFLLSDAHRTPLFEAFIITSLFLEAWIGTTVYRRFRAKRYVVKGLLVIETTGIAVLLAPTGGIESPFIWYSVNPLLVAGLLLPGYFIWAIMVFYVAVLTGSDALLYDPHSLSAMAMLRDNSNVILVFILITLVLQLYSTFVKQLSYKSTQLKRQQLELAEVNTQLQTANTQLQASNLQANRSLAELRTLYQTVEAVTAEDDPNALFQMLAAATAQLTHTNQAFFWVAPTQDLGGLMKLHPSSEENRAQMAMELQRAWEQMEDARPICLSLAGDLYAVVMVQSSSECYALMGCRVRWGESGAEVRDLNIAQPLLFMADLSAVILDRRHLEATSRQLLIAEEQNRIANEMHDNVSQNLFSIVYAIHAVQKQESKLNQAGVQRQLSAIKQMAEATTQEFRQTIYRLSTRHHPSRSLAHSLQQYLDGIRELNEIVVHFNLAGDEHLLTSPVKSAVYRIVSEASGNAVRHGKCTELLINLTCESQGVALNIKDNGIGFDVETVSQRKVVGLGLQNIKNMVQRFGGVCDVDSEIGMGTEVKIRMNNANSISTEQRTKGAIW